MFIRSVVSVKDGKITGRKDDRGRTIMIDGPRNDYEFRDGVWHVQVNEDESVTCNAEVNSAKGIHYYMFSLSSDGFASLIHRAPKSELPTLMYQGQIYPKGEKLEGDFYLGNDFSGKNFIRFRHEKLIQFAHTYSIDFFRLVDPNEKVFRNLNLSSYYKVQKEAFYTDGITREIEKVSLTPEDNFYTEERRFNVAGATWVIVDSYISKDFKSLTTRTLYSSFTYPWMITTIPEELKRQTFKES